MKNTLHAFEIDRHFRWQAGTSNRLARQGKLPHVVLPNGEFRFELAEIEALCIRHEGVAREPSCCRPKPPPANIPALAAAWVQQNPQLVRTLLAGGNSRGNFSKHNIMLIETKMDAGQRAEFLTHVARIAGIEASQRTV
jgi:hypothetical protein